MLNILTLIGDTYSGKTTHAKMIARDNHALYISSGDIARVLMDEATKDKFANGELSPHGSIIEKVILKRIDQARLQGEKLVVLDGFPRTMRNKDLLEDLCFAHKMFYYKPCAIYIDVPEDIVLKRSFQRKRDDYDTAEIIAKRRQIFLSETKPVFDSMLRDKWIKFALRVKFESDPLTINSYIQRFVRAYINGHMDADSLR